MSPIVYAVDGDGYRQALEGEWLYVFHISRHRVRGVQASTRGEGQRSSGLRFHLSIHVIYYIEAF